MPVPLHEVVYERLVEDFETEARRLVALCGLEWEPACLRFLETKRPVKTAGVTQVRQPLPGCDPFAKIVPALPRWR
jgi:hypothetical protein